MKRRPFEDHPDEIRAELEDHLERRTRALIAKGWTPEDAAREARRRFGAVARVQAECEAISVRARRRQRWSGAWAGVRDDALAAWRAVLRRPGLSGASLVTVALAVGTVAAVLGIVQAVLLRPLPFPDPGRLGLVEANQGVGVRHVSPRLWDAWQREVDAQVETAVWVEGDANLAGAALPRRVRTRAVSETYFATLGMTALLGSLPGSFADQGLVMSERLWRTDYGADPDVIGLLVDVDGVRRPVAAVLADTQRLADADPDLWVPLRLSGAERQQSAGYLSALARLRPGVDVASGVRALQRVADAVEEPDADGERVRIVWLPMEEALLGQARAPLLSLTGAVLLLLLLSCANLANLLLASVADRRRELSLRSALGAGRRRLLRLLLLEQSLVSLGGGALGVLVAYAVVRIFVTAAPADTPRLAHVGISPAVVASTFLIALVVGLSCAGVAAFLGTGGVARAGSMEGRGAGGDLRTRRWQATFVGAQAATALVLVVAGGLMLRTARALAAVPVGYDASVVTAQMSVSEGRYREAAAAVNVADAVLAAVAAVPGVSAVSYGTAAPLVGGSFGLPVALAGQALDGPSAVQPSMQIVAPGYFAVVGIPLLAGAAVTESEDRAAARAVVVNETLAASLGGTPSELVGRALRIGGSDFQDEDGEPQDWRIAGVVADARGEGPRIAPAPVLYFSPRGVPPGPWSWVGRELIVVLRASDWSPAAEQRVRAAVAGVDPTLPLADVRTLSDRLAASLATEHMVLVVLGVLALAGLALASVGVAGVVAHGVTVRTREIGVRMALGSTLRGVRRLVLRQALRPVLIGAGAGLLGAVALARLLTALLFGVSATDPTTFLAAASLLAAVAAVAAWLPTRGVARVDPARVLTAD